MSLASPHSLQRRERKVDASLGSHKRYDPAYNDAKMRSAAIGDFSFFTSYMSQPKSQLETFRAWAGIDSDISYYLNSHHVSFGRVWQRMRERADCTRLDRYSLLVGRGQV